MKKTSDSNEPVSIQDHETLGEYCKRNGIEFGTDTYKNSRVVLTFRERIRRLQAIGRTHGIIPDELLLMLSLNFGWTWDNIPFGKFEELNQFPQSMSGEQRFAILWPEWHGYCHRTTEAQRWQEYLDKLPLIQGMTGCAR